MRGVARRADGPSDLQRGHGDGRRQAAWAVLGPVTHLIEEEDHRRLLERLVVADLLKEAERLVHAVGVLVLVQHLRNATSAQA